MGYGHATRALAAIRAFEAETAKLLCRLPQLDAERASWQDEVVTAGMHAPGGLAGHDRAQVRPPTALVPLLCASPRSSRRRSGGGAGSGAALIVAGPARGRCCPETPLLSASAIE